MVMVSNLSALFTSRQLNIQTNKRASAAKRLSSGYQINSAADDAAKLSISEEMRAQIRGLNRGAQNVQEGITFCNVAEGALNEVHAILGRIKELSVAAANGTYTEEDRQAMDNELTELKKEINRISKTTEYNTIPIFDAGAYKIDFFGSLGGIQIFDAADIDVAGVQLDPDNPACYGGIIVNGTRVKWEEIDPDMVYTSDTGQTLFKEGSYNYSADGIGGVTIICEEGSKPPQIKVEYKVTASSGGIAMGGVSITWETLFNEDGEPYYPGHVGEEGFYTFDVGGVQGGLYIEEGASISDIVKGIQDRNTKNYKYYVCNYDGTIREQAVDVINTQSQLRLDNKLALSVVNGTTPSDTAVKICADNTGIWVENSNAGGKIAASFKSWQDLGIRSWDSLNDISSRNTYKYIYKDSNEDYNIEFDFKLLDETSIDSVIAGINDMKLSQTSMESNTNTTIENAVFTGSVTECTLKAENKLTVEEELNLGRDFDVKSEVFADSNLVYVEDTTTVPATDKFTLEFLGNGKTPLKYESVSITSLDKIKESVENQKLFETYYKTRVIQKILQGNTSISQKTLAEVVGSGNITNEPYMSQDIILDSANMSFTEMTDQSKHIGATIDFSGLGSSYNLVDLLGTGFNSTCQTCSNHYSISFVYGGTDQKTTNDYSYSMSKEGSNNYILEVDLESMIEKNISTGEDFTGALLEVIRAANFEFHFTNYVADGAKLHIVDDRTQIYDREAATFGAVPYNVNTAKVTIELKEVGGNRKIIPTYNYIMDQVLYEDWSLDKTGDFIRRTDPSDPLGSYIYELYKESDYYDSAGNLLPGKQDPTPRRCKLEVKVNEDDKFWEDFYKEMKKELTKGKNGVISLKSTDFDYVGTYIDENPNEANVCKFTFKVIEGKEKGFWIQSGANQGQGLSMVWDGFATYTLGLSNLSLKDFDDTQTLIRRADYAVKKISKIRSTFGAYTNTMEHMYSINTNTSENLQHAESIMRDANMANEMLNYATANILAQAAQSVLAQSNSQFQNMVLQLLQ